MTNNSSSSRVQLAHPVSSAREDSAEVAAVIRPEEAAVAAVKAAAATEEGTKNPAAAVEAVEVARSPCTMAETAVASDDRPRV